MRSSLYQQHFILNAELPKEANCVSLINARVTRDHRGTILTPDSLSQCLVIKGVQVEDLYRLSETCTGIGALGIGAKQAGWEVTVVNEKQPKLAELLASVSEAKVVLGDIAFGSTVGDMHRQDPRPSALAFGFNCQSFSKGGDMKGGEDERAMTLPRGLHAGYLLGCPIIVLECVAEAPTFAFVKQALSQFCEVTGFVKSEIVHELHHIWVANRQRWWCVLTHGELGQVPLSPMPQIENGPAISDFFDEFPLPEEHIMKQLELASHEISQLKSIGADMNNCEAKKHVPLPTALHSWGNQFQACKCECRSKALSSTRMLSRGFYGVLIKQRNHEGVVVFRHPSAQETALLCGLPMKMPNVDARLELCAVGQLASPLQSSWVFAEIRQHLKHQNVGQMEHITPKRVLWNLCQELFELRQQLWPEMQETLAMKMFSNTISKQLFPNELEPVVSVEQSYPEISSPEDVGEQKRNEQTKRKSSDEKSFAESLTKACKVSQEVKEAKAIPGAVPGFSNNTPQSDVVEVSSRPEEPIVREASEEVAEPVFFQHDGMSITPGDVLAKKLVVYNRVNATVSAIQVKDGATVKDLLAAEGFRNDDGIRVVSTLGKGLHKETMLGLHQCVVIESIQSESPQTYLELQLQCVGLARYRSILVQHGWVAVDEMKFYLCALSSQSGVAVIEPMIISDLGDVPLLTEAWLHDVKVAAENSTVITAILWCGHWIPFVFQQGPDQLIAITSGEGVKMWPLTQQHDVEVGDEGEVCKIFPNDCGFQAIAWIGARIGKGSSHDREKMDSDSAEAWRFLFWQNIMMNPKKAKSCRYIHVGGHADELHIAVAAILKEHGVFGERVMPRAKEVVDKLGKHEVQQAIASIRPWVALKQLANQASPKLNLVWEDEFNVVVKARAKQSKPVGWKRKDGENKQTKVQITPADINVPAGVFVQEDGTVVQQIAVQQVGSVGKGLVVCLEEEANQFVHEGCLSAQGLAFAVVNPSQEFISQHHAPERFPACCVTTQEPMLVSAVVVQKGRQRVMRAEPENKPKIDEVPVKTAKILVYKDQVDVQWQVFHEGPMKYILSKIKCLAVCRKQGCMCESWHVGDSVSEPLLDVWNRDYLTLGFKKSKPQEAELFACAVRVRSDIFDDVMAQSGQVGIYVEPRSDDGKTHCDKYHTVWLNKMVYHEAIAACAKAKTQAFLIRVNRRYGLKTKVEHANDLHQQFRAEVPMVQGAATITFTVGPLPWGTTRKSLQELFNTWGWQARALQPAGRSADGKGLLWNAIASSSPSSSVVQMEHGDIIIVRKEIPAAVSPEIPTIEASNHTRKSLQSIPNASKKEDPWADAASRLPSVRAEASISSHQIQQLEKSLEQKIIKKIGGEDVSMESAWEPRVKELEQKMAMMSETQQSQMNQTNALAMQVQAVQVQVEKQSREFQTHLDSKLESQMNKIEALLTKRARQE